MRHDAEVTPTEWDAWRRFAFMRRQLERALEKELQQASGISGADYDVLLTLLDAGGRERRAGELSELLGWEKSRLSHQVTRMVARGLVARRECDSDGRGTWIGITDEGRRAVLASMRIHAEAVRRYFFDVLSDSELETVRSISERVLDAVHPPACPGEDAGADGERGEACDALTTALAAGTDAALAADTVGLAADTAAQPSPAR